MLFWRIQEVSKQILRLHGLLLDSSLVTGASLWLKHRFAPLSVLYVQVKTSRLCQLLKWMIRKDCNTSLKPSQLLSSLVVAADKVCDVPNDSHGILWWDIQQQNNPNWMISLLNIGVCVSSLLSFDYAVGRDFECYCSSEIYWCDSTGSEWWGGNNMGEKFCENRVIQNMKEVEREPRIEISVFVSKHQINFQCSKIRELVCNNQLLKE